MDTVYLGIGLPKTGLTSLGTSFKKLNLGGVRQYIKGNVKNIIAHNKAVFLCDLPIPHVYQYLDKCYSNLKFIYTERNTDSWLRSCEKHWGYIHNKYEGKSWPTSLVKMVTDVFGTIEFDPDLFVQVYARHRNRSMSYFTDRKEDLLTINICNGEGWEKLLPFLGIDQKEINVPFPHRNKTRKST